MTMDIKSMKWSKPLDRLLWDGAEPSTGLMCLYMMADHWTGNLVNTEPDKCEGWNV